MIKVGQRCFIVEHHTQSAFADHAIAGITIVNERAFALRPLQHASHDEFLKRSMRCHQRDRQSLAQLLGAGHLLAGAEEPGIDGLAHRLLHRLIERLARLGYYGLESVV